jgi:hypothetical protein
MGPLECTHGINNFGNGNPRLRYHQKDLRSALLGGRIEEGWTLRRLHCTCHAGMSTDVSTGFQLACARGRGHGFSVGNLIAFSSHFEHEFLSC